MPPRPTSSSRTKSSNSRPTSDGSGAAPSPAGGMVASSVSPSGGPADTGAAVGCSEGGTAATGAGRLPPEPGDSTGGRSAMRGSPGQRGSGYSVAGGVARKPRLRLQQLRLSPETGESKASSAHEHRAS